MKLIETPVKDAYLVEPDRYDDHRGFFQEIYNFNRSGEVTPIFVPATQVNWSYSHRNVIRGIHKVPFFKVCTCVSGELWDVVVDLRKTSPTYKKWFGVWLNPEAPRQLFVPPHCGHGFFAATDNTILIYAQGGCYEPSLEESVYYADPTLNIEWPKTRDGDYILSDKDQVASRLS